MKQSFFIKYLLSFSFVVMGCCLSGEGYADVDKKSQAPIIRSEIKSDQSGDFCRTWHQIQMQKNRGISPSCNQQLPIKTNFSQQGFSEKKADFYMSQPVNTSLSSEFIALNQEEENSYLTIYDRPYSLDEQQIDRDLLLKNTGLLVGAGVGTMAILYMMPSSFTNWEDDGQSPFSKWWDNVSHAPVWDKDDLFLNYIAHPYVGAIYYMGARSAGANAFSSFMYSFALSTFFWEYGIESFAERPSIQDLIVTPVGGAVLGEWFYVTKRNILENDGELWDSEALGTTALFLMDPMTEVTQMIWPEEKPINSSLAFHSQPMLTQNGQLGYGINMSFNF